MAIGHDNPADRSAGPVHLGVRVIRPADLDRDAGTLRARRAIEDVDEAGVARLVLAGDRPMAHHPQAYARRVAEQRQLVVISGTVVNAIGGSSAAAYRASSPLSIGALELPHAEADHQRNGGEHDKVGRRAGASFAIRPSRRGAGIPGEQRPCPSEAADRQAPRPDPDQVHPPGRLSTVDAMAATTMIADDEDQEGRRPVADVEAAKVEPAGAAPRRESRPSRRTSVCAPQRGQMPASAAATAMRSQPVRSGVTRRAARPSRPRRRST